MQYGIFTLNITEGSSFNSNELPLHNPNGIIHIERKEISLGVLYLVCLIYESTTKKP